jgi:hypothetical protein
MNKLYSKLFILICATACAAGCGTIESYQSSNANVEDQTRDTLGLKKTGIAECDEVIEILAQKARGNSNAAEQSWMDQAKDKAITEVVKQQIYNYVNEGNANRTPKDREDLTQKCRTALSYLKDEPKK